MALAKAVASDRVRLLGWSEPFDYEAGVMGNTSFPAGTSMRVCVGTGDHEFDVLKVKTDEVFDVLGVISKIPLLGGLEIEFEPSVQGRPGRLLVAKFVPTAPPKVS